MGSFEVVILSPEGLAFEGEALSLYVPSRKGPLGILPGYTPTISPLTDGVAILVTGERITTFFGLRHGVLEVKPEKTFILVREAKRCSTEQEAVEWVKVRKPTLASLAPTDVSPDRKESTYNPK